MSIKNTATQEVHPEWVMGGDPNAIVAQENRGQEQLVSTAALPKQCDDRGVLESAGVVFGAELPGDPLFVQVVLPQGWRKRATEHHLWTELIDDSDRVRAHIFYKAAFYDRDAFMNVVLETPAA